jgi:hypothetical protein
LTNFGSGSWNLPLPGIASVARVERIERMHGNQFIYGSG